MKNRGLFIFWYNSIEKPRPALFKRQVNEYFSQYKAWLVERFCSTKGLTLKLFEKMLEQEGHIMVTNKK